MTTLQGRTLFQLSYPLFLQSLVMFGVMILDMMIFSAHGPQTAAALSVAGQVLRVMVELSAVMGIGAVVTIARQLGRGRVRAARLTASVACVANGVAGLVMGAALAIGGPLILRLMALEPGLRADASDYLHLAGAAMAFLCFGTTAIACLRGFGHSRVVMVLGILGAVFYLTLEYLLVLRADLGARGAGLANLALRAGVALVLAAVTLRMLRLDLRPRVIRGRWPAIRRMAAIALPGVSDFIAYGFYQIILVAVIATQGEVAVLSRAYVMIAMSFLTLVIMAIVQGSEVLIGFRQGSGQTDSAWRQAVEAALIASALSMGCAVLIWAGSGAFVDLFTPDPAVHDLSRRLLWLTIWLQPCFAVNMVLFHALRAVADVRWPVLVSQALTWGLGLPLAWIFCVQMDGGAAGVWYAFIIEELAKATAMAWRWNARRSLPPRPAG
ncbi:MAG: MATE family efflux transporter [Paracoccus sp. (in: a-proteobacteria)]|uniref:MATE family efflux transporter n=1 Tax=Paracoccus sp. TaxID=267 RepID=UPI0026DFB004|nr:MATE family efflux transporter [Paracoccus sp. (in: a-proteobacteria)]MDO5611892.1 MATE family efflux transporter [Paracoccus sp. (in: a-proteobacteria)]